MDDLPPPVLIARGQLCLSAREQVQGRHKLRLIIHQPFQCTWQMLGWELAVSSPHYVDENYHGVSLIARLAMDPRSAPGRLVDGGYNFPSTFRDTFPALSLVHFQPLFS